MPHSELQKSSSCDVVVFRKRPLDIVCLVVWNGRRSISDRGASPAPIRFPPDNFKNSLTLFSMDFSRRRGQRTAHIAAIRTFHRIIQSVGATGDERFARQYRSGPPPDFPLASPLTPRQTCPRPNSFMRNLHSKTRWFMGSRSVGGAPLGGIPPISFLAPYGFTRPLTRTHVRLLGPCFKTGRMGSPQANFRSAQMPKHAEGMRCLPHSRRWHSTSVSRARAFAAPPIHAGPRSGSIGVPSPRCPTSDWGSSQAPIRFPPDNFKHSLTLFSKSFLSFPRGSGHDGALTLSGAPFQGTWARSAAEDASPDYDSDDEAA
ncbi:hypothetical protein CQW23_35159 [Capsicum baccatum]|uniref:Protein TAR1 n=1 Tax=Capsicum baccatum TaxID=33114 RepID=A0A2G2UWR8_CAPBA|nr:hypothetical protein CQW23_35159 [Capsicum baccatum]